ncbi:hypothetical protein H2198_005223 [Neophaeococcomyces mojaviensis]|uniref:Uncharacterized protein n=1 Tax=Neophaeococcomyces mojaviensis TaxID=3383035 RepID=A0ACC3A6U5_9EURO|nr:hypothetical protein H2198_005223 [Knufia sp. JES_112]
MLSYSSTKGTSLEKDFDKEKEAFSEVSRISICSTASEASCLTFVDDQNPSNVFRPGTTLTVNARGIGVIRFPLPSSELQIQILGPDGSPAYVSKRAKACSGNATLSHAKLGDLISTQYRFGPNREPVLKLLQGNLDPEAPAMTVKSRWTSRATTFVDENTGKSFTWSYAKRKDANGKKVNVLVLRQHNEQDQSKDKGGKILALLFRGDETRTPGSTKCGAGNGGQLVLDEDSTSVLDEALIVATCLVMLKKEIDRRRMVQIAMISGMVSGGS